MLKIPSFSCRWSKFEIVFFVDILKCFYEGLLAFNWQEVDNAVIDDLGKRQTALISYYLVASIHKICF
jgi:hypothetical protein